MPPSQHCRTGCCGYCFASCHLERIVLRYKVKFLLNRCVLLDYRRDQSLDSFWGLFEVINVPSHRGIGRGCHHASLVTMSLMTLPKDVSELSQDQIVSHYLRWFPSSLSKCGTVVYILLV